MQTFIYRWKIPEIEKHNFASDWEGLTKHAKLKYGVLSSILYQSENGDFIAIAKWPSNEAWKRWKEELANHPMRQKYRGYRISGPETLSPIVVVDKD